MLGSIGRPRTPPALLISSTASNVALSCERSIAAVTPVWENSTPTRQVILRFPPFYDFRHSTISAILRFSPFRDFRHVMLSVVSSILLFGREFLKVTARMPAARPRSFKTVLGTTVADVPRLGNSAAQPSSIMGFAGACQAGRTNMPYFADAAKSHS